VVTENRYPGKSAALQSPAVMAGLHQCVLDACC
jgi:hypothetical protein